MTARPQISALLVAMLAMMLRGNLTLKKNYWFMRRNPQWRKKPSNECQGSKLHTNLMKSSWNLFSYELIDREYLVPLSFFLWLIVARVDKFGQGNTLISRLIIFRESFLFTLISTNLYANYTQKYSLLELPCKLSDKVKKKRLSEIYQSVISKRC